MIPIKFNLFADENKRVVNTSAGKFEIVDVKSGVHIPLPYDYVYPFFKEGRNVVNYGGYMGEFTVEGGKFGVIDYDGKEIVPCIYDSATIYMDGFMKVKINGKTMEIDYKGDPLDVSCDNDLIEDSELLLLAKIERISQFLNSEPQNIGYYTILISLFFELGNLLTENGKFEEAEKYLNKAIEIAEEGLKRAPTDFALNYIYGQIFYCCVYHHFTRNSPYETVVIPARKNAAIFKKLLAQYPDDRDIKNELAGAYTNLSSIFINHPSHLKEGLSYAEKALAIRKVISGNSLVHFSSFEYATIYQNMGEAYKLMKNMELCEHYLMLNLEECQQCYKNVPDNLFNLSSLINAYSAIGEMYLEDDKFQQALDYFNKATEYAFILIEEKYNYSYIQLYAECFYNLFKVLKKINRKEEALNYSIRALTEYSKIHIKKEMEVLWKQKKEMINYMTENSSDLI